jgi:hypothetical protein
MIYTISVLYSSEERYSRNSVAPDPLTGVDNDQTTRRPAELSVSNTCGRGPASNCILFLVFFFVNENASR